MNRLFRRVTDSWRVPCAAAASQVLVGKELIRGMTVNAFQAVNTSRYWVRLKGSQPEGFNAVADHKGWIIAPGATLEASTQYPEWVSGIAVERPGFLFDPAIPFGELELYYGYVE